MDQGPLQKNSPPQISSGTQETLELEITDLSRSGPGVGRAPDGRVVFVPLTAPGDHVRVRITSQKKRFAEGELVELISPSARSRIPAKCEVFGRCGGCQWQHIPYELQFRTKVLGAKHALERVGFEQACIEEYPAKNPWNYRNRIQMRAQGNALGFFERGSRKLVNAERCEIAREELNRELATLRAELPRAGDAEGFSKVELEVSSREEVRSIWNAPHAAMGFRQVNDEQNEVLVSWIQSELRPGDWVLDLFGGDGNLTRSRWSDAGRVDVVDVGAPAAASSPFPGKVHFHRAPVLPWLRKMGANPPGFSGRRVAVFDPPREGLTGARDKLDFERIEASLRELGVFTVLLVGCDVDAWARDVSRFLRRDWTVERMAAVDLFPQTSHLESLAKLTRLEPLPNL